MQASTLFLMLLANLNGGSVVNVLVALSGDGPLRAEIYRSDIVLIM
jgi:hypothetical protein